MSQDPAENSHELKREVGAWGSFSMGYADVGADIYLVLGVILFLAGVLSPLAFAFAAVVYVSTGLCYAELSTRYPVAGGGHFFSLKAFGPLHGFIAGWGLMLSYTVDIALFAIATVGYLQVVAAPVLAFRLTDAPYLAELAIALVLLLLVLNLVGIRYSSKVNELIVAVDLVTVALFLVFGLPSIIGSGALVSWLNGIPSALESGNLGISSANYSTFVEALSLATVSYIGIESISQAAEETKNPSKVIPRATKAAIFAVVAVALALSTLAVTLALAPVANDPSSPAYTLAKYMPVIGPYFPIWVGIMGTLVCYISTNTGVIGVSRVTFSMSRLGLLPRGFNRISSRFRTPYLTLIIFTSVACLLLAAGVELSSFQIIPLIASVYNFGALIAYFYVNAAAIVLRFKEPTHEGWKMPLNITVRRWGRPYQVSIIPFIGIAFTAVIWVILVLNNPGGRIAGTAWFVVGIAGYLIYQKRKGGRKPDAR